MAELCDYTTIYRRALEDYISHPSHAHRIATKSKNQQKDKINFIEQFQNSSKAKPIHNLEFTNFSQVEIHAYFVGHLTH